MTLPCSAQQQNLEKPDAPTAKMQDAKPHQPRVADRKFWLAISVLGAAKTADAISTVRSLDRGATEANPIFGRHPSGGRLAVVNAASFAGEAVLTYELKQFSRQHKWARWIWLADPALETAQHIRYAWHNEALPTPR